MILGHNSVLCMDMQLKGAELGFNTTWLCTGLFHREELIRTEYEAHKGFFFFFLLSVKLLYFDIH